MVLRAEDAGRSFDARRGFAREPAHHREQVAAVDPLTGRSVERLVAGLGAEPFAVRIGAVVLPRDRRPDRGTVGVFASTSVGIIADSPMPAHRCAGTAAVSDGDTSTIAENQSAGSCSARPGSGRAVG